METKIKDNLFKTYKQINDTPELIMMVGIPGSGKSTILKKLPNISNYLLLSSDQIRMELTKQYTIDLYSRDDINSINKKVFEKIRVDAIKAIKDHRSVIFDATNLERKYRISFLNNFTKLDCIKKCYIVLTSIDDCINRNENREGIAKVPKSVIYNMLKSFDCPNFIEGWDEIEAISTSNSYKFPFDSTIGFSQDNPHHKLSLYDHLCKARDYMIINNKPEYLKKVAYYHDIGKLYTKTFKNTKGEITDVAHFYNHEKLGAYLYLTEMCCGKELSKKEFNQILYETNLINMHMRAFLWEGNQHLKNKDTKLYGENFILDLVDLNKADNYAKE